MSREGRRRDSRNRCDCFLEKRTTHAVAKPDRSFQKPTHEAPGQSTSASLLPKMRGRGTGQTRGVTPREGGWHSCFPSPSSDGHRPQDPASGCRWLSWAESDQENSFYHKVMTRPLPAEGPGHGYCKLNKAFETPESCPLPQNESQDTLSPRFVWKGQKDSEKKNYRRVREQIPKSHHNWAPGWLPSSVSSRVSRPFPSGTTSFRSLPGNHIRVSSLGHPHTTQQRRPSSCGCFSLPSRLVLVSPGSCGPPASEPPGRSWQPTGLKGLIRQPSAPLTNTPLPVK